MVFGNILCATKKESINIILGCLKMLTKKTACEQNNLFNK